MMALARNAACACAVASQAPILPETVCHRALLHCSLTCSKLCSFNAGVLSYVPSLQWLPDLA